MMFKGEEAVFLPRYSDRHIVAWRAKTPVLHATFQWQVASWQRLLAETPGTKFALFLTDTLDFMSALFGCWLAGKTVYLPGDNLPITCQALNAVVDGFLGEFPPTFNALTPSCAPESPLVNAPLSLKHNAVVIYTSGSSGDPQAISKSLAQLVAEISTLEAVFGPTLGSVSVVATVSHQHIYGLLFKVLWPFFAGRAIYVQQVFFLAEMHAFFAHHDCVLISSPAHLKRLHEDEVKLPLKAVFSSGAPLNVLDTASVKWVLCQAPIEIYGSSETGGIAWRQNTASWQALPNVHVRISQTQVLEVQSPHLPDPHWWPTSDYADAVADGGFLLRGRIDRIVKLEGKRIALAAIERALVASPFVSEARVVMLPTRERLAAVVVLTTLGQALLTRVGKAAFNQQLSASLKDQIDGIAVPRRWCYQEALPVDAQGKTSQAALMALVAPDVQPTLPNATILRKDANEVCYQLHVPENLIYFDGHFAALKVLPGVVQIDWAIHYGRLNFVLPPLFKGMQVIKFQRLIQPGMTVCLDLRYDASKQRLEFRLHSNGEQHASGRLLWAERS